MDPDLRDHTAVVTGAGKGLGREIALTLAMHGADVVVCGRDSTALAATERAIRQNSRRATLAITADVTVPADVETLRAQTVERFGDASILINAAGIFGPIALIADSDPHEWIQTLLTNTVGPYLTAHAFVGGMVDAGWGRIVNVSSAAAFYPPGPLNSAYATSKAALNHFTRHLAAEVATTGVTANVLHPGSLKTAMWEDIRVKVETAGPHGDALREWVTLVDRTGGDSIGQALQLILSLLARDSSTNGSFCWPEGMLHDALPSW